ncbi:cytochrome-c peroxidase [Helicobacter trogontum]|uniref:C-type cytochrome n=1 Tax=Helicobacter trogontum TaxID=50960 RepID=A0A4U8TG57_9HELI|nr:cytochrome c peroxidase [Helicobacter trogontum]MCI5786411.1 c-type cytochrome [Helicobacter trogontum]MDY5184907.1 cytochrome c peroxidase [Helicobacter trogontum]TLD99119.1 c-type cytochrome [Helicobacter trogontum]
MNKIKQKLCQMKSKIIFFGIAVCSSSFVFTQLVYGFEDIGAKIQSIAKKAHSAGLKPISEGAELATLQKGMFDKKSNFTFSEAQLELGKILYFDPRLSNDGMRSCNTCHNITMQGTSTLDESQNNPYHLDVPTIYNMLFNDVAYYKGIIKRHDKIDVSANKFLSRNVTARATLYALKAKNEMNGDMQKIIQGITNSKEYMSYFIRAYGTKVKIDENLIAQTLAGFIMSLNVITRFDDFLNGNLKALSISEVEGLDVFIERGCVTCHNGVNLGGTMQPFEVIGNYKLSNLGKFGTDSNKMLKVPTLRNVVATAPYFHNGGFKNLDDAIKEMGRIQIGIKLSNKEITKIIEFLESLNGEIKPITIPILPRATF